MAFGLVVGAPARGDEPPPLRAGMIGLDTSHVIAFAKLLHGPNPRPELRGIRIVAAYPGGSPDIPSSRDRVAGFTKQLRDEYHVEIVDSVAAVIDRVDVVFLESNDGRTHWQQAEPVLRAKKPVFIDKPVAGSLADAVRIYALADQTGTPCFSSSGLRFSPSIRDLPTNPGVGAVVGADSFSPCPLEEHHPDLFWYGIHGVESLYTVMGPGCQAVRRVKTPDADNVTGTWADGRLGTFRGIRQGKQDYGAIVFGSKGIAFGQGYGGYEPLLVEVCRFFRTGKPPVSAGETLEIYAFMEAADESKRRGGTSVPLAEVLDRARAEAGKPAP